MGEKKKKKEEKKGIILKGVLFFFICVLLLLGATACYAFLRIGSAPSESEKAFFAKLSNYKNGKFLNFDKVELSTRKFAKKPGFFRFIFASSNAPKRPYPRQELIRKSFPDQPEEFNVCWLGHSSLIFELGGVRFMVDPVFGNAAPIPGIVRRFVPSPLPREELPELDFVVISHDHYDHLEYETIRSFRDKKFPIVTSLGVGARLRSWGIPASRIIEMNWNNYTTVAGVKIVAHPARHFSGRTLDDRFSTLWSSFSFERNGKKIFYGADSGYGRHFEQIGKKHGPFDLVCLEIDAWNERWPQNHSFPSQVIKEFQELKGKKLLPIHWGVFDLADHAYYDSINQILDLAKRNNVPLLLPAMGERKRLP